MRVTQPCSHLHTGPLVPPPIPQGNPPKGTHPPRNPLPRFRPHPPHPPPAPVPTVVRNDQGEHAPTQYTPRHGESSAPFRDALQYRVHGGVLSNDFRLSSWGPRPAPLPPPASEKRHHPPGGPGPREAPPASLRLFLATVQPAASCDVCQGDYFVPFVRGLRGGRVVGLAFLRARAAPVSRGTSGLAFVGQSGGRIARKSLIFLLVRIMSIT